MFRRAEQQRLEEASWSDLRKPREILDGTLSEGRADASNQVLNPLAIVGHLKAGLRGPTFISNTLILTGGTVVAQGITLVLSFLLTRLYAPSEFGHFSVFVALCAALSATSTAALEHAIVLARSDSGARRIGSTAMGFAVGVGVVVAAGGLIAHGVFESAFSLFELTVLVPLFVCFYGIAQSFLYLNLRANRVPLIASLKVAQSVFTGGAQALLAGMGAVSGLVVGSVAGWTLVGGFGLVFHFSNRLAWADLRARAFAAVFRRNRRFPRYVLPNVIVDNFSNQLPTVLIGAFVSLTSAGHYGLAIMVLSAPAALVSQAVGQVFLQHIGRVKDGGWVYARTMFRIWAVMSALGLVPFGVVAIFAPSLFAFAFGSEWVGAGLAAQALAPLLFLRFVSSPTSSIYLRLGLQRQQWWFGCAALVYRAGSYSLPIFGFDMYVAILTHVILEMTAIFAYNLAALYFMTKPSWGSKVVG